MVLKKKRRYRPPVRRFPKLRNMPASPPTTTLRSSQLLKCRNAWIYLAQDRNSQGALVIAVMKLMNLIFMVPCIMLYSGENNSNKMQQLCFLFAMALLYMFRVTISPIIRSTMLYMATGELAHLDTEQQDRDYLQLHNDRTTLLLTNLITT